MPRTKRELFDWEFLFNHCPECKWEPEGGCSLCCLVKRCDEVWDASVLQVLAYDDGCEKDSYLLMVDWKAHTARIVPYSTRKGYKSPEEWIQRKRCLWEGTWAALFDLVARPADPAMVAVPGTLQHELLPGGHELLTGGHEVLPEGHKLPVKARLATRAVAIRHSVHAQEPPCTAATKHSRRPRSHDGCGADLWTPLCQAVREWRLRGCPQWGGRCGNQSQQDAWTHQGPVTPVASCVMAKKCRTATRIQACFRGWLWRLRVLYNPHTTIGARWLLQRWDRS